MDKTDKIYVAGHTGAIGNELIQLLEKDGYSNVIVAPSSELDLTDKTATEYFFRKHKPEYVFLLAATRGSIQDYREFPTRFFTKDMQIYLNVLDSSWKYKVKKLLFLSSVCVYPERQEGILHESDFRSGWVPKDMEAYALAKAAGMALCEYYNKQHGTKFISAILGNIYGDTKQKIYDNKTVIPSLISNIKQAINEDKNCFTVWGNGEVKRDFLHVRDCVKALLAIMQNENYYSTYNISGGKEITINELAEMLARLMQFKGKIEHDYTKPNGSNRAKIDIGRIKELGWNPEICLEDGLKDMLEHLSFED